MRRLIIPLHLAWLTVVAAFTLAMTAAFAPAGGVLAAEFANTADEFRALVAPDGSIATLNAFRASLAADMLFLLAYGLLLRYSVRQRGPSRWSRTAEWGAVVVMFADATENVAALALLRMVSLNAQHLPSALLVVMNAAAIVKWNAAGLVMLYLASRWRVQAQREHATLRWLSAVAALGFVVGAAGSLSVAAFRLLPSSVGKLAAIAAMAGPAVALLVQFVRLDVAGVLWRFLLLARVPVTVLAIAALFGPLALGPAAPLLGGILDVNSTVGLAVVTGAAVVLGFACGTQINLIRAYAWQRMFDGTLRPLRVRVLTLALDVFFTTMAATLLLVFCIAVASADLSYGEAIGGVAGGIVVALCFLLILEWISAFLSRRIPQRRLPQLAVPFDRLPWLGPKLRETRRAKPHPAVEAVKDAGAGWSIGRFFGLQSGYVDKDHRLLPGHLFATAQFALSLLFYAALTYDRWNFIAPQNPWVPTAASVLLLLLLVAWALSAVAFFLDRYRLPLFTGVIVLALATGRCDRTDHVVTLSSQDTYDLTSPGALLAKFGPRPIVVAAAGGGIQAGAWSARVLQGLHEALGSAPGFALRDRLALVTGVSGGSMGAMFYGAYRDVDVAKGTAAAQESSLDDVASALIGPDLLALTGWRRPFDRGVALETSWVARLPSRQPAHDRLADWAHKSHEFATGESDVPFPAFLFNTTIVETGQAMPFATTQFPTRAYRNQFDAKARQSPLAESANLVFELTNGDDTRGGADGLQVATAARLSAAFPYVSPAATLGVNSGKRYHLVDGGYYDNYGLVVTSQWLDDALSQIYGEQRNADPPFEIDIVIIRSLVDANADLVAPRDPNRPDGPRQYTPDSSRHGWAWQLVAPPKAFINGRTFGQWAGGNQVLRLLIAKWAKRQVTILPHLFDLPASGLQPVCRIEPLSWKLTTPQRACITDGWNKIAGRVGELMR